jgi:uncharacterized DUF497 family protein
MPWTFVFDPAKSAANLAKHGIDFVQAQALWTDENRVDAPLVFIPEPRRLTIGSIRGKVWTCVYTYREEAIRLISCRHARRHEVARYTHHRGGV